MKLVENISINGLIFSIDSDAYVKLGSYLDILGKYFENEQGGREIITDIEARVSELFAECGDGRVITLDDVTKVIETLGAPEDIAGADVEHAPMPGNSAQTEKPPRRLYRAPDQRFLGGVCAGIAAWIGISPIIVRIVFIVLTIIWGISIAVYCLLWIIIPKAKTTAQKLEMRGEPVNINTIEKNIRERLSDPTLRRSFQDFIEEAGELFGKIFGIFGRIVGILAGIALFFLGVGFAIAMILFLFFQDIIFQDVVEWDFLSFTELFRHIISPAAFAILFICCITVAALTIFAVFFWGAKLISGFRVKHKLLHVGLAVLWIAAIVTGIVVCISQVRNFAWRNDPIVETRQIASHDTLYLALAHSELQISNNPVDVYFDKETRYFYGKPTLRINKSDDSQTKLEFSRRAQGANKRNAYHYAENIDYSVIISDSALIFAPFFMVNPHDRWKFQTLNITLYVPEGTVIIADEALCHHDRILGAWFRRRANDCISIMTENKGLQRIEIEKIEKIEEKDE